MIAKTLFYCTLTTAAAAHGSLISTQTLTSTTTSSADDQRAALVSDTVYQAQGRLGNHSRTADFDVNLTGPLANGKGQSTFQNGATYNFLVSYVAGGASTFFLDGSSAPLFLSNGTLDIPDGPVAQYLFVITFSQNGSQLFSSTVNLTTLMIGGISYDLPVGGNSATSDQTSLQGKTILVLNAPAGNSFANGFLLGGTWTPVFPDGQIADSKSAFQVELGSKGAVPEPGSYLLSGTGPGLAALVKA